MDVRIRIAETDEDIASCFDVMSELRPHLDAAEFLRRVKRQQANDRYKLVFLEAGGEVKAVAGLRVGECLAWGKFMYVDDLVTSSGERSRGHGQTLFDWLVRHAEEIGCEELHLDSAVHRFGAHRFYLRNRMDIACHHFGLKLKR
ncbi:MAG: GNAT family N-acetyltransferase [Rubrivivax sp.]|nr:GNAT family N-acetyltransferase [Pyrinomonadaceae bacterium]